MKKYIITITVILGVMLIMFGSYYIYSNTSSQEDVDTLKSKVDEEIKYLDSVIVSIMNKFNNITYANYKIVEEKVTSQNQNQKNSSVKSIESQEGQSGGNNKDNSQGNSIENTITNISMDYSSILVNSDNKKIEWNYIKKEIEKMYSTWTTVLIDLNALNVNNTNLLKYNSTLDDITQALENEDKKTSMIKLADLYSLLVSYIKEYSSNNKLIQLLDTKSNILYAYSLAEYEDKWSEMKNYTDKAQNVYNNIINNELKNNDSTNNINKAYVLLNEISKSTSKKDKNIFYINYKNLMKELEIIQL
mgnify:FL=1